MAFEDAVSYPFDEKYEGDIDRYRLIARAILAELWGRDGIGDALDNVDDETSLDVIEKISAIIRYGSEKLPLDN